MKVKGADELKRRLSGIAPRLAHNVLPRLLDRQADALADALRDAAPVLSGATRDSVKAGAVHASRLSVGVEVSAGDPDEDILAIEYGRIGQDADPFVRRTAAKMAGRIAGALAEGLAKST